MMMHTTYRFSWGTAMERLNRTLGELAAVLLALYFALQPVAEFLDRQGTASYAFSEYYRGLSYQPLSGGQASPARELASGDLQINRTGLELIKHFEGFKPTVYRDEAGNRTIGYGHKIQKGERFTRISEDEAEELLVQDLLAAESAIRRHVKVDLTEDQFAALVSFVFNVGPGSFSESTLLRKLNQGRVDRASREFHRWTKAGGESQPGLERRRAAEAELFASGSRT